MPGPDTREIPARREVTSLSTGGSGGTGCRGFDWQPAQVQTRVDAISAPANGAR